MSEETCALCGRQLGTLVEKHHLVPKSRGGRRVVPLHPICHRKIHATFSDTELAAVYDTPERLKRHPAMARFIRWLAGKPPDFHKRTAKSRR